MTNTSNTTSYDKFCINMKNALKKQYKEEKEVRLQTVRKVNGVLLQGITISKKNGNIMPTLYLDKFFRFYEEGMPFEKVVHLFMQEYQKAGIEGDFDIQFFSEYEKVKPRLFFKLLNYQMNQILLEQVPHYRFLDLAVVCYCDVREECIGHGAIMIRNEHLELWGIDSSQLIRDSLENMPGLYPPDFMNMAVILKELYPDPVNLLDRELPMFVLTNKERINGAASLLYKGQLESMGAILGQDYYVLPSSVHEVIIIPKCEGMDEEELSRMVDEINHEKLAREDLLSDHAYCYYRKRKELVGLPAVSA